MIDFLKLGNKMAEDVHASSAYIVDAGVIISATDTSKLLEKLDEYQLKHGKLNLL